MSTPHLDIAITRYDHKRALFDGSVTFDGLDATLHSPAIPEIFAGLASDRFDVAEFGLTHYLRALDVGTDLVAIPVFPARVFRHSSVFVNTGKGITGLADLVGRTIGEYGMYGQDSGIWAKGIFTEDYGFAPETNRWVVGGLETPLPAGFEFTTHRHPDNGEVEFAPPERTLSEMLDRGELDALFASNVPMMCRRGVPPRSPIGWGLSRSCRAMARVQPPRARAAALAVGVGVPGGGAPRSMTTCPRHTIRPHTDGSGEPEPLHASVI